MMPSVHTVDDLNKYEGTEKLLEIWFFNDDAKLALSPKSAGLRQLTSESSLFITNNRIILKTCGQTQILNAVRPLIQYAMCLGFTKYVLYYSRLSFLFPELQAAPHRDFRTEIAVLEKFCETGSGYTFGRLNADCWNFYCGQSMLEEGDEPPGQTMELMMRGLNPKKMEPFYAETCGSADEATRCSGISDLFPKGRVSSYLFTPCGYSANGLMNEDEYFTIHVTPQPEFSYASFETNVAMDNYMPLIERVLAIFEPDSFICTFISDLQSPTSVTHAAMEKTVKVTGYRRADLHAACMASERKLTFAEFYRTEDVRLQ
ncbi:unnamed protein product [Mesocestoides corti]|uniref:Adenosylmethionine decarboxylase n=1 Tax=Mesocestoides corti TaxID=53468 RepID=A0A0R3U8U0_MESCO|nr:unnamed protein product [Mesocestoides corti]